MEWINMLISLISGAVGGNLAGAAFSEKNLGTIANSIVGLLGAGGTDLLLRALGVIDTVGSVGGFDLSTILANIGIGAAGGGVLTSLITLIKDAARKNKVG